ncbi:2,3-butanediol dehydrogenase [Aquabacterium sp.]|uniref:2,3-butanediol dehydrogenase n=1 Tax=Aquabacterium sp. TaxID=1872578 RepID=UPI002BF38EBA|nr:2,3-butanediol dehydrogenase [Aquabacterium sp.]HSW06045.1 2,3-butanediol dehydrogenase [Aquabacterium sp.]
MKALRWHGPRDLRLVDLLEPSLRPREVRIRVAYCGICGSDLHEYVDGPHAIPVDCPHPISGRRAPLTLGHEFCGTVVESADPGVAVDARVAIEPEYRCGACDYCLRGQYNRCTSMGFIGLMGDGGMAESVVVPSYTVHPLPDEVGFDQAAALEPAAVALHAVRMSGLQAGDACAVFGMGPVGLLTVAMLRQCGAGDVIAVDVNAKRLAMAGSMGASGAVDASREDSTSAILGATSGRGAAIAFEVAGSQATLDATLGCLRKGGEAMLVGLMGKAQVDIFDTVNRELRLTASVGYRDVFPTLIAWTARGLIDPAAIVTRKVSLRHAVPQGFDALLADKGQVKVLVAPFDADPE